MGEILLWVIVSVLLAAGVVGSLLPVIPGTPMILAAAILYGFSTDFQDVSWWVILILTAITALAQVIDWLASVYGARRYRASRWGLAGGLVGGILGGLLGGLPGLILCVFLGSFLAEWVLGGQQLAGALAVGWGSLLGFLGGTLLKGILALTMVGIFLYSALM
jgi:uncharacterized protein YqgC (DUF456 family)